MPPARNFRRDVWNRTVSSSLRMQVRMFLVVFIVTVILTVERVIAHTGSWPWALAGFATGILIGIVLARTKPLSWDAGKRQVVVSNTLIGTLLLVLYVNFVFQKSDIIGSWIDDAGIVGVIGMAITSGVMWGRAQATFRSVSGILRTAGLPLEPEGDLSPPSSPS